MSKAKSGRSTPKGVRPAGFRPRGNGQMIGLMEELRDGLSGQREQLAEARIPVSSGGGLVTMTFDGLGAPVDVKISPELTEVGDIEDLVLAAMRAGHDAATAMRQGSVEGLGHGLDLSAFGVDLGL